MNLYEIVMNYLISSSNFSVRLPLTEATRELVRRVRRVRRCLWIPNMFDHSATTLPWIRGEGVLSNVWFQWEASAFIAAADIHFFHPFFILFSTRWISSQWFHSVSTSFFASNRLQTLMGRCNDSTTQRVCFFWDGSQGLSFEKRQVPGQLHGSDQAGFLLFFFVSKWHFVERNVRSKPNGPSSSRCRQADGVLVAF